MRLSLIVAAAEGGLVPVGDRAAGVGVGVDAEVEVTGVVITDLLDPRRYLVGGELVLTGLVWWRPGEPERSHSFVAALVGAGAAAVAAGEAEIGWVPDDLIEACAAAGLPLLRVPVAFSFATIADRVNRHLSAGGELAGLLARHRGLVAAIAARSGAGAGLAGVLDLVATELGVACWVISPTGRLIAGEGLAEAVRHRLARRFLASTRVPTVERGLRLAATNSGRRAESWILVSDGPLPANVADELTALAALERDLASRPPSAAEARVGALLQGAADLAAVGEFPAMAVVATGSAAPVVLAEAELVAVPAGSGEWIAVVGGSEPAALVERLRGVGAALTPGLDGAQFRIGVSDAVSGGTGLVAAVGEARSAAASVAAGVAGPDRLSTHPVLLAAVPAELAEAYRRRVLGPLIEHDATHRTDLVRTLQTYLECDGSWSQCAARMHLHVNTLRYRVERIEALTGRDLRSLTDQTDLLLALRISGSSGR